MTPVSRKEISRERSRFDPVAGAGTALRAFYSTFLLLGNIRLLVPSAMYLLAETGIVLAYVSSTGEPWTSFWALFVPGVSGANLGHFPEHLILMQVILGRFDIIMEIFVHIVFQGAIVILVSSAYLGRPVSLPASFANALRRYLTLVMISLLASVAIFVAINIPISLARGFYGAMRTVIAGSGIVAGLIIQALFLYAVPFALLSDRKFSAAVGESMRMVWRSPADSFLLVLFPFILTLPMMFLSFKAEMIALRLSPDIMIHIYLASEVMKIISSFLITAGATILFIRGYGDPAD